MVCGERVVWFLALSAYPAGDCVVSDLFGSLFVVAFVVGSVWFGVLLIPDGLAACAACGVNSEGSAVEAGSGDRHLIWCSRLFCRVETKRVAIVRRFHQICRS